jgi:acetoin utilization protein AcuB
MIAKDLLTDSILPLKTSDTGLIAISLMEEYKVSHLPIVNHYDFLGLISAEDILSHDQSEAIGNIKLSLSTAFVEDHQHIYDVFIAMSSLKLTILPVIDKQNHYLGSITLLNLVDQFSNIFSLQNPGGIIVLEVNENDYSFSEIAQVIESNDAKVLNLFVTTFKESTKIEITIKINKIDIFPVLQTFERYKYNVTASFTEMNYKNYLQERYDSLMNYLNI